MSGLSGFWTVYLRKTAQNPLKIWTVFLDKPLKTVQILRGFWAFFLDKTVQKPLKPLILKQDFERNCLKKPLKPLKSCFKLGEKSWIGMWSLIYSDH